jgi:hypothetical protein
MRLAVVTAIALAFAYPASAQAPSAGMASWTADAKSGSLPLYPTPMGSPDTEQWFGNSLAELKCHVTNHYTIPSRRGKSQWCGSGLLSIGGKRRL